MSWASDEEITSVLARCRRAKLAINPYLKIVRAELRGTGVRLTAEDIRTLCLDHAIYMTALQDTVEELEEIERQKEEGGEA